MKVEGIVSWTVGAQGGIGPPSYAVKAGGRWYHTEAGHRRTGESRYDSPRYCPSCGGRCRLSDYPLLPGGRARLCTCAAPGNNFTNYRSGQSKFTYYSLHTKEATRWTTTRELTRPRESILRVEIGASIRVVASTGQVDGIQARTRLEPVVRLSELRQGAGHTR